MDLVGVKLADGAKASILTGVDDRSRFCVVARALERGPTHLVCDALAHGLRNYGVPEQILTDNGKVFTSRLGPHLGETLFDRVCRQNGIEHILTKPYSPTTTGKGECFHRTLRLECLSKAEFDSIGHLQTVLDGFVETYNSSRPHQALDMATPSERFYREQPVEAEGSSTELEVIEGGLAEPAAPPPGRAEPILTTAAPVSSRAFEVTRKWTPRERSASHASAIAPAWLAGKTVTVRCVNARADTLRGARHAESRHADRGRQRVAPGCPDVDDQPGREQRRP